MLGKPNKQKDFFDSYVYENLLPTEHILLDIKEEIDFSFVEEETKDLYDNQLGRPSFPPEVMFKMLFLEFYYTLSDVEIAKQIKYNILYRYFVALGIHDDTPDDTSLVVFRRRLGQGRFERLFNRIVEQAKEKNLLEGRLKIVDASKIIADVAIPNSVNLLRQGRKLILRSLRKLNRSLARPLIKQYYTRQKLFTKPSEEELFQEITLSKKLIKEIKGKYTKELDSLCEALAKISRGEKEDQIVSFTDLDARFGKTSRKEEGFAGYKAHISEDESEIITSVDVLKGNADEGSNLKPLLEKDNEKGIISNAVVADAKYDSAKNRIDIHQGDMAAYIPSGNGSKKYLDNFVYDDGTDTVICQEGYSPISKTRQEEGYLYIFSTRVCKNCQNRELCPKPNNGRIRVFISDNHKLKLIDNTPQRREALIKRKMIERKFAEAKKWHGLRRARYRGRWKVAIQALMTFLVMNAKRIVRLLKSPPIRKAFQPALAIRAG
jgi:IS5 family transposase